MDDSGPCIIPAPCLPAGRKAGIQKSLKGLVIATGLLVFVGVGCTATPSPSKSVPTPSVPSSTAKIAIPTEPAKSSDPRVSAHDVISGCFELSDFKTVLGESADYLFTSLDEQVKDGWTLGESCIERLSGDSPSLIVYFKLFKPHGPAENAKEFRIGVWDVSRDAFITISPSIHVAPGEEYPFNHLLLQKKWVHGWRYNILLPTITGHNLPEDAVMRIHRFDPRKKTIKSNVYIYANNSERFYQQLYNAF